MQFEVRRNWTGRPERWFSAEEVSHHITPDSLWLVAHGKVYDVTRWVEMHPGGAAALLRRGGLDATREPWRLGHDRAVRRRARRARNRARGLTKGDDDVDDS